MARQFYTAEERQQWVAELSAQEGEQSDSDDMESLADSDDSELGEEDGEVTPEPVQEAKPERKQLPDKKSVKSSLTAIKEEHRQEYDPNSKIPAPRWNNVLDERNSLRQQVKQLKAGNQDQRQSSAKIQDSIKTIDQEIDELLADNPRGVSDVVDKRIEELERRQQTLLQAEEARAVREEVTKLESEIASVQKQYPLIDRNLLIHAVRTAEDPDAVDLMEVAERWESLMESEFERRAKARGMNSREARAEAKSQMRSREAPRPRSAGSSAEKDFSKETVNLADPKQRLAYAKQLAAGIR